jgi:hypothetical protein
MNSLNIDFMLRYLYHEMSAEESQRFMRMINGNAAMMEQFAEIKEGMDLLNGLLLSPSPCSVDRIMAYAAINGLSMQ